MKPKSIYIIMLVFFSFAIGILLVFLLETFLQTSFGTKKRNAYEDITQALALKLKNDVSYVQYFKDDAKEQVKNHWPSDADSFCLIIDDHFMGSFECRVFFDTGVLFYLETSSQDHEPSKITHFEKMKWPDY